MQLRQAVDDLCNSGDAGLLICIPGRLAYWHPELGLGEIIERK